MADTARFETTTVYVIYIASTLEDVWQALTSGEFTARYWGGRRIESDWRVGAPVRHVRPDGGVDWQGEVLRADPPTLLSYTFAMQISDLHRVDRPSRVTFGLVAQDRVVKLTLTHEHSQSGTITQETTGHGWPAILSSLKSVLETGQALPFQGLGFGPREIRKAE